MRPSFRPSKASHAANTAWLITSNLVAGIKPLDGTLGVESVWVARYCADEYRMQMGAIVRRRTGEDAVVVGRETLRFHQCLLPARRTAGEVRMAGRVAIERRNQRFGELRHRRGGTPAKILSLLRMTGAKVRGHPAGNT